jgi:hypothetical protein
MSGILCALLLLQDGRSPEFTRYEIARERVGHKVVVDAVLLNPAPVELADAKATVLYFDGDDEIRRSPAVPVPRIPPGKTGSMRIEVAQVPNFSRFEIYLEFRGMTRLYLGGDPTKLPQLRRPSPARLSVESQRILSPAPDLRLAVSVKNGGESESEEPTLALTFGTKRVWVRLDEALPPASLHAYEVVVPGAPAGEPRLSTVSVVTDPLPLGDSAPPGARELALRRCRIDRLSGGTARISGVLSNGHDGAVGQVQAVFKLGRQDVPFNLPGVLKPGESRAFEHYVPDCPPFETAGFSLSFEGASKDAPAPAPPPSARRTGAERVEIGQVRLPAPPERTPEEKAAAAAPPPTGFRAEIRGLLVVDGQLLKNGKYTGDVYLFRVAFTDVKGALAQPTGTFTGTIYDGPKPLKKLQRIITKESWKVESSRVNGTTATETTTAFDRKTGELWVAFHLSEGPFEKPRADLELELEGPAPKPYYVWRGLSDKWQSSPRWPEKK